jgi:hypothetical protein
VDPQNHLIHRDRYTDYAGDSTDEGDDSCGAAFQKSVNANEEAHSGGAQLSLYRKADNVAEELDLADGRAVHADEFLFQEGFRLLMPF